MTLWSTVFCYKNCWVSCLLKNASFRFVFCCSWDFGGGGGQRGLSLCNKRRRCYGCSSITHNNADVNALYMFGGAFTGSSYVAQSRCYINTPELTNSGGHCTSMFPMPQIGNVDQIQPFLCHNLYLWSLINLGLTLTYLIQLTGNEC